MSASQKEKILKLRANGASYGNIAAELNVSVNTVKSVCRRSAAAPIAQRPAPVEKVIHKAVDTDGATVCRSCGQAFPRQSGKKPRKFCSDACRVVWWNANQSAVKQKAVYNYVCPRCGSAFSAYGNANRKYCSHACYIAARFGGKGGAL